MKTKRIAMAFLFVGLIAIAGGCNKGATASSDSSDYVPGAFPPTLSDMEYHEKSWVRSDCLTCHEEGTMGAPPTVHESLTAEAKQAKCRSCHVFIPGSEPRIKVPASDK